jgi:hypothetical protein
MPNSCPIQGLQVRNQLELHHDHAEEKIVDDVYGPHKPLWCLSLGGWAPTKCSSGCFFREGFVACA